MRVRPATVPSEAPQPRSLRPELSDGELVERALGGDDWAKEALFRRHVAALTILVTHVLRSRQDADDIVQDAFAEAYESLARLRDRDAFRAWLSRIAVNGGRKLLRRRRFARMLGLDRSIEDQPLAVCAIDSASPEAIAELRRIDEVIKKLPTDERVAWILRHVEGESLESIAELLGCSLSTAKRRLGGAEITVRAHVRAT